MTTAILYVLAGLLLGAWAVLLWPRPVWRDLYPSEVSTWDEPSAEDLGPLDVTNIYIGPATTLGGARLGAWDDPRYWSAGRVPRVGDEVLIDALGIGGAVTSVEGSTVVLGPS